MWKTMGTAGTRIRPGRRRERYTSGGHAKDWKEGGKKKERGPPTKKRSPFGGNGENLQVRAVGGQGWWPRALENTRNTMEVVVLRLRVYASGDKIQQSCLERCQCGQRGQRTRLRKNTNPPYNDRQHVESTMGDNAPWQTWSPASASDSSRLQSRWFAALARGSRL